MCSHTYDKVIAYYDENGFCYCPKHGRSNMDTITNEEDVFEPCSVCGEMIINLDIKNDDSK